MPTLGHILSRSQAMSSTLTVEQAHLLWMVCHYPEKVWSLILYSDPDIFKSERFEQVVRAVMFSSTTFDDAMASVGWEVYAESMAERKGLYPEADVEGVTATILGRLKVRYDEELRQEIRAMADKAKLAKRLGRDVN